MSNIKVIAVDMEDSVYCDNCEADYTNSDDKGGILFQSKAICPKCTPTFKASIVRYKEEKFIRAKCPKNKSFADWVRQDLREPVPTKPSTVEEFFKEMTNGPKNTDK